MAGGNVGTQGVPIAGYDLTALGANQSATTIYAIPASRGGMYRVHMFERMTVAGATDVLPAVDLIWTGGGVTQTTGTSGSNAGSHMAAANTTVNTAASTIATLTVFCDASTNLQFQTTGGTYANGGTYEIRFRVEYLG